MLIDGTNAFTQEHAEFIVDNFDSITTLALLPLEMADYVFKAQNLLSESTRISLEERNQLIASPNSVTDNLKNVLKENLLKGTGAFATGLIVGAAVGPLAGAVVGIGALAASALAEKNQTVRTLENKASLSIYNGWRLLTSFINSNELTPEQQAEMDIVLKILPHVILMDDIASRIFTSDQMKLFVLHSHGEKWLQDITRDTALFMPINELIGHGEPMISEKLKEKEDKTYEVLNKNEELARRICEFNTLKDKFEHLKLEEIPQLNRNQKRSFFLIEREIEALKKYEANFKAYQDKIVEIARQLDKGNELEIDIQIVNSDNIHKLIANLKKALFSPKLFSLMEHLEQVEALLVDIPETTTVDINKFNFNEIKADADNIIKTLAESIFTEEELVTHKEGILEEQIKLKNYIQKLNNFLLNLRQVVDGLEYSRFTKKDLPYRIQPIKNYIAEALTGLAETVLAKSPAKLPNLISIVDFSANVTYRLHALSQQSLDISTKLEFLKTERNALVEILERKFSEIQANVLGANRLAAISANLQERFKREIMEAFSKASLNKSEELALYLQIHSRYIAIGKITQLNSDYASHLDKYITIKDEFKNAIEESKRLTLDDTGKITYVEKVYLMRGIDDILKRTDIDSEKVIEELNAFITHPRVMEIAKTPRKGFFNSLEKLSVLNPVTQIGNIGAALPNPLGFFSSSSKENIAEEKLKAEEKQAQEEKAKENEKKPKSQILVEAITDILNKLDPELTLDDFEDLKQDVSAESKSKVEEPTTTSSRFTSWFKRG